MSEEKCFDNVDDGRRRLPSYKLPMSPCLRRDINDLTLKKSDFLDPLCFKIAIIQFIPMRQPSGQRHNFFLCRLASNLMLPA